MGMEKFFYTYFMNHVRYQFYLHNMDWSPRCAWLSQSASIYHLSHNLELQETGNYDRNYTSPYCCTLRIVELFN